MKRIGKPWFWVVALLIFALAYLTFFGVYGSNDDGSTKTYIRGVKDIRWGTDIQGGVNVTFGPQEGVDATDDQMDAVKDALDLRLIGSGVTDYELYVDKSTDRVMISFPWKDGATQDVNQTISELSATAELLFVEGLPTSFASYGVDENGSTVVITDEEGTNFPVALNGSHIEKADVGYDNDGMRVVSLEFTDEGAALFESATSRLVGNYLTIMLDFDIISSPMVNEVISGKSAIITSPGGFSAEEAALLVNYINSGALPFTLDTKDYSVVDATLGKDSLRAMLIAGIIAFIGICLIMLFRYRLPGFVACIALLGQAAGMLAAVSGFFGGINSFTLTLPGIAGIILSIGMGVDANVITSERIREELYKGKTIDGAIDAGNANSISAIVDGNVTNIIVAVILMGVFGPPSTLWSKLLYPFLFMFPAATTGSIYSFGYTLLAGVIFNFIMAVLATRIMLKSLSGYKGLRHKWLYGGAKEK